MLLNSCLIISGLVFHIPRFSLLVSRDSLINIFAASISRLQFSSTVFVSLDLHWEESIAKPPVVTRFLSVSLLLQLGGQNYFLIY